MTRRTHGELVVLGWLTELREAEERTRAEADADRAARAVLSTYSPRRQWVTRHGAVFVEGVGFTRYAGEAAEADRPPAH